MKNKIIELVLYAIKFVITIYLVFFATKLFGLELINAKIDVNGILLSFTSQTKQILNKSISSDLKKWI